MGERTENRDIGPWIFNGIPNHYLLSNMRLHESVFLDFGVYRFVFGNVWRHNS